MGLVPRVYSFSSVQVPLNNRHCSVSTPCTLFGFRSTLRKTFSSLKRKTRKEHVLPTEDHGGTQESHSQLQEDYFMPTAVTPTVEIVSVSADSETTEHVVSTLPSTPVIGTLTVLKSDAALYSLPPVGDRDLTKLEVEFRNMLDEFAQYSHHDIESLRDPRMRILFEGVAASAGCQPVYRAFEVLYEDLYPLRVAGRLVYKNLQQLMADSQRERDEEVALVVKQTGLLDEDVEATRLAFVSVAARLNGDTFLTKDQLRETGLADTAMHVLGFDSVDGLLERLVKDKSGKVGFTGMMIGLQETAEEICGIEKCNPTAVMHEIMQELREHPPTMRNKLDTKRQRYSDHYDDMLVAFQEWENLVPEGQGRRLDVVRGCFVGAKNEAVVEALRVVYVDYAALRVAGDIIFKLVKGVMSALQQRQGDVL